VTGIDIKSSTLRILIVILILANLAFAAWALLIDRPVDAPAARDISHLPRLVLASEPASTAPPAAATAAGSAAVGAAANAHCVTLGPFSDLATAAAGATLLQGRGFVPTQRDEPGQDLLAYWVHLDNVPSDAAATRLLQKLHDNGLADARAMPVATATEMRRISVGLFNKHDDAIRRAREVKSLGLTVAVTEQHESQATYWLDINLKTPDQSISTEGLLPPAAEGAHLEIRDCPVSSSAPAQSSGAAAAATTPATADK
jgi:hypothetical protein